jgi:replicative DNA helicase
MANAEQHGANILAAIIPSRRDLLDQALQKLVKEHFTDVVHRNIFLLLGNYVDRTGAVLPAGALQEILSQSGKDAGSIAQHVETYEGLVEQRVDDSDFKWSILQLRDLAADRDTQSAITESMQILTRGAKDDAGNDLKGHLEARNHAMSRFSSIERSFNLQDSPEGDMTNEREEMLQDYADRKSLHLSGRSVGVLSGVPMLDNLTSGFQPGELDLIVGYSSSGKTSFACGQLAWAAAVEQGKNVVIATTETLRPQVRRKLVSRHSLLPSFELPRGLNSRSLKDGTLTQDEESVLQEVTRDLTHNPNYGKLYIAQVPRAATISTLESRLYRIQRKFNIDLIVIDYLALLKADTRRNSLREELDGIIKGGKAIATTFNDGQGVPVVSPWQVNRKSRDDALKLGYYTTMSLAESAEATNTPDIIISLLEPAENNDRYCPLSLQILKNRDGETTSPMEIIADYATSSFKEKAVSSAAELTGISDGGFNDLLGL